MFSEFTLLPDELEASELAIAVLAPRPKTIAETGMGMNFLGELTEKHLFEGGVLSMRELVKRTALSGNLLEEILHFLRKEGRIEVRPQHLGDHSLAYALTERGRGSALASLSVSGYVGPTPVTLTAYTDLVRSQSVRLRNITRGRLEKVFADTVLDPALLDRLGPAVNSGRAIFVYGDAGTGKTYVTKRLAGIFDDACLIPHAIALGDTIIRIYDPSLHRQIEGAASNALLLQRGHDPRYVLCKRPVVITGGELTADMLEIQFDPATRQYRAPLQLKANGGIFILDDLGRQRVEPAVVLNRWIVPMEEGVDYLSISTGQHFQAPFDLVLVFSTNLKPEDLADEAFLRRIGYKIRFQALKPQQYQAIWQRVCEENSLIYNPDICQFVIDSLHEPTRTPLLPCHPGDLIGMAIERMEYLDTADELDTKTLQWAWDNYFVTSDAVTPEKPEGAVASGEER